MKYLLWWKTSWIGPFEVNQIKSMIQNKTATLDDYICEEGKSDTVQIKTIPDFFMGSPIPPPPQQLFNQTSTVNFWAVWLLCLFFGWLGAHRFYLKKKLAILQLLTIGGLGIWQLIDLFFILRGTFKDSDDRIIQNQSPALTWSISIVWVLMNIGVNQTILSHLDQTNITDQKLFYRGKYTLREPIENISDELLDINSKRINFTVKSGDSYLSKYGEYTIKERTDKRVTLEMVTKNEVRDSNKKLVDSKESNDEAVIFKDEDGSVLCDYRIWSSADEAGNRSLLNVFHLKNNRFPQSKNSITTQVKEQKFQPTVGSVSGLYEGPGLYGTGATMELYRHGKFLNKDAGLPEGGTAFGDWVLNGETITFYVDGQRVFEAKARQDGIYIRGQKWKKLR